MESLILKNLHLSKSELADQGYKVQNDAYGVLDRPFLNRILSEHPDIKNVLDIGSAEGSFILPIVKQNPNVSFTCIDVNEELIGRASEAAKVAGIHNANFRTASFDKDYDPEQLDLIFTRFALEHSSTPQAFVDEAFRRLNPGGIFAIVDETWLDDEATDDTWRSFKKYMRKGFEAFRCNLHVMRDARGWLEQAGFTNVELTDVVYAPSTVGSEQFKALILTLPILMNKFLDSELWPRIYMEKLEIWIDDVIRTGKTNPTITFAHITAQK